MEISAEETKSGDIISDMMSNINNQINETNNMLFECFNQYKCIKVQFVLKRMEGIKQEMVSNIDVKFNFLAEKPMSNQYTKEILTIKDSYKKLITVHFDKFTQYFSNEQLMGLITMREIKL